MGDGASWWADPAARWLIERSHIPCALFDVSDRLEFANDAFRADLPAHLRAVEDARRGATTSATLFPTPQGTAAFIERAPPEGHLDALQARIDLLERERMHDPLTGAWNMRFLDACLPNEVARSERYKTPLSLLVIDVDHFKQVNDTYGHAAGNDVLCVVVGLLQRKIRQADRLVRWGGDEFAVLAASTPVTGALVLAESLRTAIEANPFPSVGRVTISLGVAERLQSEAPAAWFERADRGLREAKQAGGNGVRKT